MTLGIFDGTILRVECWALQCTRPRIRFRTLPSLRESNPRPRIDDVCISSQVGRWQEVLRRCLRQVEAEQRDLATEKEVCEQELESIATCFLVEAECLAIIDRRVTPDLVDAEREQELKDVRSLRSDAELSEGGFGLPEGMIAHSGPGLTLAPRCCPGGGGARGAQGHADGALPRRLRAAQPAGGGGLRAAPGDPRSG